MELGHQIDQGRILPVQGTQIRLEAGASLQFFWVPTELGREAGLHVLKAPGAPRQTEEKVDLNVAAEVESKQSSTHPHSPSGHPDPDRRSGLPREGSVLMAGGPMPPAWVAFSPEGQSLVGVDDQALSELDLAMDAILSTSKPDQDGKSDS